MKLKCKYMLTQDDLKQIAKLIDDKFAANNEILMKKMDESTETLARTIQGSIVTEVGEMKEQIEKLPKRSELHHYIDRSIFQLKDDVYAKYNKRFEAIEADIRNLKKSKVAA